jgi:GNAT superfamily N-acetyltransferase
MDTVVCVIRPAQPDDVPTILALIRELANYEREPDAVVATDADLTSALFGEQPALFGLIAEDADGGNAIAGFALWFLNFSTWIGRHGIYLEDLYVRPEFRGHGHGRELLTELARIADERGYGRLEWSVLDWNEPAHRFYASLGAVPMQEWTTWRVSGAALPGLAYRSTSIPDDDGQAGTSSAIP